MRLKLDENLGTLGRNLFTAAGHDVMTVSEQRMSGVSDEIVYDVCRQEQRILVTLDRDFAQVLRFPPAATPGIAVLSFKGRLSPSLILGRMTDLLRLLSQHEITGCLWIVESGRVRIHQ